MNFKCAIFAGKWIWVKKKFRPQNRLRVCVCYFFTLKNTRAVKRKIYGCGKSTFLQSNYKGGIALVALSETTPWTFGYDIVGATGLNCSKRSLAQFEVYSVPGVPQQSLTLNLD